MAAGPAVVVGDRRAVADFVALGKPRVVLMVVFDDPGVGYDLGGAQARLAPAGGRPLRQRSPLPAPWPSINSWSGDLDARMQRQLACCLDGRLQPGEAAVFGALLTAGGIEVSALSVGWGAPPSSR